MAKAISKKTVITHPATKRQMKFDAAIYEPVKAAIIQSLKGSKGKTFTELSDDVMVVPAADEILAPMLSVIPLQLLAYYIGIAKDCDVDKPRNLAKSVTVE